MEIRRTTTQPQTIQSSDVTEAQDQQQQTEKTIATTKPIAINDQFETARKPGSLDAFLNKAFNPQPDPPGSPLRPAIDDSNLRQVDHPEIKTAIDNPDIRSLVDNPEIRKAIDNPDLSPGSIRGFNPQPDPPGSPLHGGSRMIDDPNIRNGIEDPEIRNGIDNSELKDQLNANLFKATLGSKIIR